MGYQDFGSEGKRSKVWIAVAGGLAGLGCGCLFWCGLMGLAGASWGEMETGQEREVRVERLGPAVEAVDREEPTATVKASFDAPEAAVPEEAAATAAVEASSEVTVVATPTATDRPTAVPQSAEEVVLEAVAARLRDGNRDVARVGQVSVSYGVIEVKWAINDNLTEGMIKDGAKLDIVDILKAVDGCGIEYELINVEGTFRMKDKLGNAAEQTVVWATYPAETVGRINWDGFVFDDVYDIASTYKLHPAMGE